MLREDNCILKKTNWYKNIEIETLLEQTFENEPGTCFFLYQTRNCIVMLQKMKGREMGSATSGTRSLYAPGTRNADSVALTILLSC